jgi:uncharacterized protein YycO
MKLSGMILLFASLLIPLAWGGSKRLPDRYQPQEGDIVFQSLPNPPGMDLVDAIEGSTGSPFSHCGMVSRKDGEWKVIEAIGPVCETSLAQWTARGRKGKIWAYRLDENARPFIPAALEAMRRDLGKPYDPRYRFDSEAIYCSELIWRGWKAATGKGLGRTVKLGELNWEPYRPVIEAIEGTPQIPIEREMITPRDLAKAKELTLVYPLGADS